MGDLFDLDVRVRETLKAMDAEETRLVQFHNNRVLGPHINALPVPREVPASLMSKFRRTDHVVVDEARLERRKQVAAQRIPELNNTMYKLHQVGECSKLMKTWIKRENEAAIAHLAGVQNQTMSHSHANGSEVADTGSGSAMEGITQGDGARSSHEMAQEEKQMVAQTSGESSMDLSGGDAGAVVLSATLGAPSSLTVGNWTATRQPTLGNQSEAEISQTRSQNSFQAEQRYSLASTFTQKEPTTRAQQRLTQLRETEKRTAAISADQVFSSADMERYLAVTVGAVESLVDPSLDVSGVPLTMEEVLFGDVENKRTLNHIVSPWSGRVLKPIIRQDYETEPLKLQLLRALDARIHMALPEWIAPHPSPIEYRYIRPYMLPQVNKLLRDNFWPGIDISESVLYPEFSIVAMYKELVIGCAFISTLGYITYICVHPEWRSHGIAKFMLYHLIQTSPGKDITLHVSTTNPSLHLYQKFCFFIVDTIPKFYDKFMPSNSELSHDAFFMCLRR